MGSRLCRHPWGRLHYSREHSGRNLRSFVGSARSRPRSGCHYLPDSGLCLPTVNEVPYRVDYTYIAIRTSYLQFLYSCNYETPISVLLLASDIQEVFRHRLCLRSSHSLTHSLTHSLWQNGGLPRSCTLDSLPPAFHYSMTTPPRVSVSIRGITQLPVRNHGNYCMYTSETGAEADH
jgi:hypothetical protein